MLPGRNDPCPCGSGKKFKKCCGAFALSLQPLDPIQAQAAAVKTLDRELDERLLRFAKKRFGSQWMAQAAAAYLGGPDEKLGEGELQLAVPWSLHHFASGPGHSTVARSLRDEQGSKLSSDLRDLLDAQLDAWVSLWDVQRVRPGEGMELKDLLTGHECFVHEQLATRTIVERDVLLGRVVTCNDISFLGGLYPRVLPPMAAAPVVAAMRKLLRVRTRPVAKDKLRDADLSTTMIGLWAREVEWHDRPKPMPIMQNTDGDPFKMTTDHFAISATHVEDVVSLLGELPGFDEDVEPDDITFVVTRPGNPMHPTWVNTIVGSVTITGLELAIETNSVRRADSLRAVVQKGLGTRVVHRLRDQESMPAAMDAARNASAKSGKSRPFGVDEVQPPELVALLRQFKEDHYRDWVNHALPALGGLSPLEASKSRKARAQLELLLSDLQHSEARLPEAERFDFQGLRRRLGFG